MIVILNNINKGIKLKSKRKFQTKKNKKERIGEDSMTIAAKFGLILNGVRRNAKKGFTLIEMMVVMFIISLISLLVIPNIANQKANIEAKNDGALIQVTLSQKELYELDHSPNAIATLNALYTEKYITEGQYNKLIQLGVSDETVIDDGLLNLID